MCIGFRLSASAPFFVVNSARAVSCGPVWINVTLRPGRSGLAPCLVCFGVFFQSEARKEKLARSSSTGHFGKRLRSKCDN